MKILDTPVTMAELKDMMGNYFGDMVKAVADVDRGTLAIDAELHADLEKIMLATGSEQKSLWGFNIYPDIEGTDFIEYDSLINIRAWQGNRSRDVEDEEVRKKIAEIVGNYIVK